ncbi:MAG: hypothetical protein H6R35_379, partial [Bacteroidetes bacterium]|nr:hypothetical protein [Bacteroidota bacterium]
AENKRATTNRKVNSLNISFIIWDFRIFLIAI